MKPTSLADQNRPQLMAKLRRVGGFSVLLMLLALASIHWIAQDIGEATASRIPKAEMKTLVNEALARLNLILVIAGLAMAPVAGISLMLISRFVRRHFEAIEDATRRKSQLVRWVAHELRTPLNGVKGFADILATGARGPLSPDQLECLREIRGGAAHMKTVLNDLLDLAKIEAGSIALAIEDLTVAGLIADVQGTVGSLAEARKVRLLPEGDLGLELRADFNRTRQVILNLVSNALKFSPEGRVVHMGATAEGGMVLFSVRDEGPGMTDGEQATLFEEFRQTPAGEAQSEGAGLGLAISRRLVELQGGRIWVESRPGEGTRFSFTLPGIAGTETRPLQLAASA